MEIKELLLGLHDENFNYNDLYQYIVDNNIPITVANLRINAAGFATYKMLYVNRRRSLSKSELFYTILHEIGHYHSFQKKGIENMLPVMSSDNFDDFFDLLIGEEVLADRFACLMYFKLNRRVTTEGFKQDLHLSHKQDQYKHIAEMLFGLYENNLESYDRAVDALVA